MPVIINGSTGISGTDGSAGTPAVQGTDTNTGIFFPAADTIAFAEGGVEVLRIDPSANVGIGTSSPTARLHVNGDMRTQGNFTLSNSTGSRIFPYYFSATNHNYVGAESDGSISFGTGTSSPTERMRIDGSGNIGIGTSSPAARFQVDSSSTNYSANIRLRNSNFGNGVLGAVSNIMTIATDMNSMAFHTASNLGVDGTSAPTNERMRIDSSGNLGIGISSPAARLHSWVNTNNGTMGTAAILDAGTQNPTVSGGGIAMNFRTNSGTSFFGGVGGYTDGTNYVAGLWGGAAAGGAPPLAVTQAGRVGIGTTAPEVSLQVSSGNGTTRIGQLQFSNHSGSYSVGTDGVFMFPFSDGIFYSDNYDGGFSWRTGSSVERMRIDSAGNIGIGTSSPTPYGTNSRVIHIDGGANASELRLTNNTTGTSAVNGGLLQMAGNDLYMWNVENSFISFGTNNAERVRVTTGGHLVCGTTNPLVGIGDLTTTTGSGLSPQGWLGACRNDEPSLYLTRNNSNGNLALFYRNATVVGGISITTTNTSYNTSSDYRLKANVVPLTGAAARVQALKPSRFNFIADPARTMDGFLAHEAAEVVPEAVTGEKDAVNKDGSINPQGIDHSKLVPLLTAALQEALAELASLKARVAALEAR